MYRGNNDNVDALMALKRETGGVRVSAHVPDESSSNKQNQLVRHRDGYGCCGGCLGPGSAIIGPDEITLAASTAKS